MKKMTNGIPPESHALLDASVLAGMTTGAVVGSMAGPPGAVLGGTIGAAVGIITGGVLDRESHAADQHDRELDDAIGVTKGDLGARDIVRKSLASADEPIDEPGHMVASAALLRAEHARLEVIFERLLDAYHAGSWPDVCAEWERFEPALRAHMDVEEREVFPAFSEVDPEEAEHLLAEHAILRNRLDVLGVNVELHAVTPFDAEELIERIRAHRAREERLLYPWMDATKEPS